MVENPNGARDWTLPDGWSDMALSAWPRLPRRDGTDANDWVSDLCGVCTEELTKTIRFRKLEEK